MSTISSDVGHARRVYFAQTVLTPSTHNERGRGFTDRADSKTVILLAVVGNRNLFFCTPQVIRVDHSRIGNFLPIGSCNSLITLYSNRTNSA